MENQENEILEKEQKNTPIERRPTEKNDKLLRIAIIGTGNCGSMMANDACEKLGLDGVAINGSERDLRLISCPRVVPFVTGDGKGTGKNRKDGKKFFIGDAGIALDKKIINIIENNDVLVVTTSAAGGFGSGASTELVELLLQFYPNKVIIVAGVLPFDEEQGDAFAGTKEWLKELLKLNVPYILYDNNKFSKRYPINKAAKKVNEYFVENIRVLQGDFLDRTFTGGIDERDMLSVLSVPGRMVIDSMENVEPSDVLDSSIIKTIKNHIVQNSAHVELNSDKEILASATMYSLGEEFDEYKFSVRKDLEEEFGYHVKDTSNFSDENIGSIAVVLSGLTDPSNAINRIVNRSNELDKRAKERKKSTTKLFDQMEDNSRVVVETKQSFADETQFVKQQSSKEDLLKEFMARKNVN